MTRLGRRARSTMLHLMLHQVPTQPFACAALPRTHRGTPGTQVLCPASRCCVQPLKPVCKLKAPAVVLGTLLHNTRGRTCCCPPSIPWSPGITRTMWARAETAACRGPHTSRGGQILARECGDGVPYLQTTCRCQEPRSGCRVMLPALPGGAAAGASRHSDGAAPWLRSCRSGMLRSLPAGTAHTWQRQLSPTVGKA